MYVSCRILHCKASSPFGGAALPHSVFASLLFCIFCVFVSLCFSTISPCLLTRQTKEAALPLDNKDSGWCQVTFIVQRTKDSRQKRADRVKMFLNCKIRSKRNRVQTLGFVPHVLGLLNI